MAMLFPTTGAPVVQVVAAAAGCWLVCCPTARDGRPGAAGAAACLCAAAVVLAGC